MSWNGLISVLHSTARQFIQRNQELSFNLLLRISTCCGGSCYRNFLKGMSLHSPDESLTDHIPMYDVRIKTSSV